MTTMQKISDLIATIDPQAAKVFLNRPFHRMTIVQALMKGCQNTKFEDVSFRIWALATDAVQAEKIERAQNENN